MLLHRERGLGCALQLSMGMQPLGCCFIGWVLRLRLLVASVAGSPAGSRDGAFLTLDLVVRCSSTSGAEIEFWRPGTLCWSPVPSTLRRLENLSVFLGFSRLWIRFSSSHCWSLLHWRPLSVFRLASAVDCCLSSPRAVCGLLQQRRVPARVLMVACLPLLRVWRTAPSHIPLMPLMLCASTGFLVNPGLF